MLLGGSIALFATSSCTSDATLPSTQDSRATGDRHVADGDVLVPWGTLPAEVRVGAGVAATHDGRVLLLHRAGAQFASDTAMTVDPVVTLDARTGRITGSWGAGRFKSPHSVSVDPQGWVWITDVMTNHVTAHEADGRPIVDIGHDYPPGLDACLVEREKAAGLWCTDDPLIFARPTDVAATADGLVHVSDGYRNSRVARFDRAGRFVDAWGTPGDADGQFSLPHGVCLRPDGALAVADRRNARVQVFEPDGRHRVTFASARIGRPFDVATGPDGTLYVLDGGDGLDVRGGELRGYVIALADDGSVARRWALRDQEAAPHQLAVGPEGDLYVAALSDPPLWRWSPER